MATSIEPSPPAGQERLVYSVAEAGTILGISRAFAYELVARGELPVIRLGRRRLVPKAALAALVGGGSIPDRQPIGGTSRWSLERLCQDPATWSGANGMRRLAARSTRCHKVSAAWRSPPGTACA